MTINIPGPYIVEISYLTDGLRHIQRLNTQCDGAPAPGTEMSAISLQTKGGTPTQADTAVNAWVDLVRPLFSNATSFQIATLFRKDGLNDPAVFISEMALSGTGSNTLPYAVAHQLTLTYKSAEGGRANIIFMEGADPTPLRKSLGSITDPVVSAVRDFPTSPASWILARDTSYLIAARNYNGTENEKISRARYRR